MTFSWAWGLGSKHRNLKMRDLEYNSPIDKKKFKEKEKKIIKMSQVLCIKIMGRRNQQRTAQKTSRLLVYSQAQGPCIEDLLREIASGILYELTVQAIWTAHQNCGGGAAQSLACPMHPSPPSKFFKSILSALLGFDIAGGLWPLSFSLCLGMYFRLLSVGSNLD